MLIKMDSEVFVAASFVWVGLIVSHHKTSDTLRLALYQLINVNWQNYEQEIMPQSQIIRKKESGQVIISGANHCGNSDGFM